MSFLSTPKRLKIERIEAKNFLLNLNSKNLSQAKILSKTIISSFNTL